MKIEIIQCCYCKNNSTTAQGKHSEFDNQEITSVSEHDGNTHIRKTAYGCSVCRSYAESIKQEEAYQKFMRENPSAGNKVCV